MKKVYFLLFVVVMIACKKDDPTLSVKDILVKPANGWVRTSTIVTVGDVQKDIFNDPVYTSDCDKDDATVFKSDGTLQIVSTVKCNSTEPAILDTGTWSLADDQKTLTITIANQVQSGTILEADESHIKANLTFNVSGVDIPAVVTFVPK
jgi:hypothetical protein